MNQRNLARDMKLQCKRISYLNYIITHQLPGVNISGTHNIYYY